MNGSEMRNESNPKVCVMGMGYIGLPTAAVIAKAGCPVHGVDVNEEVVKTIGEGRIHIEEVDLDGLVQGVVSRGLLKTSTSAAAADVFVIAVPTPFDEEKRPDIAYVLDATRAIAPVLQTGNVIILESTSPVGTTEKIRDVLAEMRPDLAMPGLSDKTPDISIAYCPERVLPGRILVELIDNDRSIGGITPRCARKALSFYKLFVRGQCITTDARSAEMTKLVENAYRDVNIAFANELSMVADTMDLNVWEIIRLANRHPRVNILQPGPGVGGHCIAVDPWFIVHGAPDETPLIRTARNVNDGKVGHVIRRAQQMIDTNKDSKVACLGLAFKANIDDFRESPALKVADELAAKYGDRISIVEPYTDSLPHSLAKHGAQLADIDDAIDNCDVFIVLVDHDIFKAIPADERTGKTVYDTRGIWE